MRLLRLEFEGVGSFSDRMQIDFETLGGAGLFLIEGPTGAGKSTILDAIVFALYGTPAGSGTDPGRLDSHVRGRDCEPFVELDFACAARRYRIRRTPRHERDKRRGTGQRVDEGGVSLVRLDPDPAAISHKAREVGDWVIEHIGLTKQQFVSTIVLAQGEFSTFLNAETKQRTPILEKIFGTQFYQQVEQQLVDMRKDALRRRAQADRAFDDAVNRCLGLLSLAPADDPVAAIDTQIERLADELQQAQARLEGSRTALQAAEDQLSAARDAQKAQMRKRERLARRQALAARQQQIESLRELVSAHDRALPAQAALEAWDAAVGEQEEALAADDTARQALSALGEPQADPGRLTEVTTLRAVLSRALTTERALPGLLAGAERARAAHEEAAERVTGLVAARARLAGELVRAQQDAVRPDGEDEELARLLAERVEAAQQAQAAEHVAQLRRRAAAAEQALADARTARAEAEGRVAHAQQAQMQNLAANLAAALVDGQACMVCGSLEHPAPAEHAEASEVVSDLERELAARASQESQADGVVQRLRGEIEGRGGSAPQEPGVAAERLAVVEEQLSVLQATKAAALAAAAEAEECRAALAELDSRLTRSRLDAQQADSDAVAAQRAAEAAADEVEEARDVHPSVETRVAVLEQISGALQTAIEAQAQSAGATAAAARAQATLSSTLERVRLPDADTARRALLDETVADGYRGEIRSFDAEVMEVETDLRHLADVDVDADTGVAHATAAVQQRQSEHEEHQRATGGLLQTHEKAAPLRREITRAQTERTQVHEATAGVIRMADLATASRGEVVHRVKLSAFVLMRRFESVVEAANDRLDAISEGRYQLRVQHTGLDNRGQAGLDLVVEDLRTERCRPTTSLSGGESFYVSLALALGLADVVRSESGGVVLGTLFIDEGFGSLDAEVLEEVIDMLEQVRAGEDRVIGLVSHVDALKQRIDPRISVRRDPQRAGVSTLEVHV